MFARRHGSARTEPAPPPSWEAVKLACSATSADLAAAANAASALGLDNPLQLAELSLSDLALLLPAVQPVDLLRLRSIAREAPRLHAVPPGLETDGKIAKPPGLHPSAFFFGKILTQESEIGNHRLGLWFEVTLIMATLLFSLALTLATMPAEACRNPADADSCTWLIAADQIVWSTCAIMMWCGAGIMWVSHWIVIMLSPTEVKSFVANHARLTSWGIVVTFSAILLFAPGLVLRVWILSQTAAPQFIALGAMAVAFAFFQGISLTLMLRVLGTGWHDLLWVFLGGFGLLPGTNRMRAAAPAKETL